MCLTIGIIYGYEFVSKSVLFIFVSVKSFLNYDVKVKVRYQNTLKWDYYATCHVTILLLLVRLRKCQIRICIMSMLIPPAPPRGWTEARQKG